MQNSRSFQGLCPLDPHQGSALDPLGSSQRPQAPKWNQQLPLVIAYRASGMIALPHQQFHTTPQFCCTPPKNLITPQQTNLPSKTRRKIFYHWVCYSGVLSSNENFDSLRDVLYLVYRYPDKTIMDDAFL